MTTPRTANDWFEEGLAALQLAWSADTQSDLHADLERAVAAFDEALSLEPGHLRALRERAKVLVRLGRHEEAVDGLVALSQGVPDDEPQFNLLVAEAFAKLGRHEASLQASEAVLRRVPSMLEALVLRAEALSALRRDALAVDAWDKALADTSFSKGLRGPRARLERAMALERLGRDDAFTAFLTTFVETAGHLHGPLAPALFHEVLKKSAIARDAFQRSLEGGAGGAESLWLRGGNVWLSAQRPVEALVAFERQLVLTPRSAQAWHGKAEALAMDDRLEEAIAAWEQALALWPDFLGAKARLKVVREALASRR